MPKFKSSLFMISLSFALVACGGGGNSSSPISNNPTEVSITCNKGIPSKTSGLTNIGLYVEPLYYLDAIYPVKYDDTGTQTKIFLNLYENSLTNGILYEKLTQLNNIDIGPEIFYKKFWQYDVTGQGIFTHNDFSSTNLGWPVSYVSNISDLSINLNDSNDQCNFNLKSSEIYYEKVDLSGKLISSVLEPDANIKYYGYKYITNLLEIFLTSTSNDEGKNYKKFRDSQVVFPQGSIVYVPTRNIIHDNIFYFKDLTATNFKTLKEWSDDAYPNHTGDWVEERVSEEVSVYYHKTQNGDLDYETDPAILYKGLVYDGEWDPKGDQLKYDKSTGQYTRFNKIAIDALAKQIKEIYLD
ncbi:hypothetical protein [Acinetobacter stercoris]|uniref:Uncharacterized protein n=1 Tax=Acinetobacter stercoris TaxID=2126983 RepID=A0A2U3MV54_9GAMM|nr:hypothetical protein [Acinetobacter stercoris]SPL69302.1 hypothetical protein KPC_0480 [Acinetobacter stercoris]